MSKNSFFALLDDSDDDNKSNKKVVKNNKNDKNILNNKNDKNILNNKIEDEMFNKYYSNRNYIKKNKNKNTIIDNNDFVTITTKKEIIECIIEDIPHNLETLQLTNNYRVLAHHNDDKNWDFNSYHNITTLTKWIDIASFFNTLNISSGETKFTDFDIFIMKNEISPLWEDPENRNGSICSFKIDSLDEAYSIFKKLMINTANNTLLKFNPETWDTINGLSFSSKKIENLNIDAYCIIIKIWFKINIMNYGNIDKLLNNDLEKDLSKFSIKIRPIKPEY
jgi:hypothetical protein